MAGGALAIASLIVRYRRAAQIERQQLKWFAAVAILTGLGGAANIVTSSSGSAAPTGTLATVNAVSGFMIYVGLALLPVAIGIAILRYRLYEIDRLISRSISYGVLTAIVGGLFVGFILVFQAVLAPVTRSNELAVAGSTLLAAALFQPLRRRVQRIVDRRFNRSRYDAERTVAAFAERLRDEVDLEQLVAEILATVRQTVEPSSVSLWLRE
jgi:predicted membrane-bound spermidine synthase